MTQRPSADPAGGPRETPGSRRATAAFAGGAAAVVGANLLLVALIDAGGSVIRLVRLSVPVAAAATAAGTYAWARRNDALPSLQHVAIWAGGSALTMGAAGQAVVSVSSRIDLGTSVVLAALAAWVGLGFTIGTVAGVFSANQRRQQRALEAERERARTLASSLSVLNRVLRHDIRNDVNVIEGYADRIAENGATERYVRAIERRATRITERADQARLAERTVRGDVDVGVVDLCPEVERAVEAVRGRYPEADVETATPAEAPVRANDLVGTALSNLVENAVEHNPAETPRVDVRVESDGDDYVVTVADDGPGIPEHELEAFEAEVESALRHSSGMGLWLSNWIVEYAGGGVDIDSSEAGATVRIRLPRACPKTAGRAPTQE
jgi:signal transduction histidine kinase